MRAARLLPVLVMGLLAIQHGVSADFGSDISNAINTASNAINSAANTTSNALGTAANAVGSGLNTATNAVGFGLDTAKNATNSALHTAITYSGYGINIAETAVQGAYNESKNAVVNFSQDAVNALNPAIDSVGNAVVDAADTVANVSVGTYKGVVDFGSGAVNGGDMTVTQNTTVDATNATSIVNTILSGSQGFVNVSNSVLVALSQGHTGNVSTAVRNIVNNQTVGYPANAVNSSVALGLSEAFVTSMVVASNYSVTVSGSTTNLNATDIAVSFITGLQDAVTPCGNKTASNVTATVKNCCYLVGTTLQDAGILAQNNGVGDDFYDVLGDSYAYGEDPTFNLARCLNTTTVETS